MDAPNSEEVDVKPKASDSAEQNEDGIDHSAQCDGCGQAIFGIRHHCPICPNWDYCSRCVKDATTLHQMHLFGAHKSPLPPPSWSSPTQDASQDRTIVFDPKIGIDANLFRTIVKKGLRHPERSIWQFSPLDPQSNDIRLLALMPGVGKTMIRCKQVNVSLVDDVSYEALSYAWGDSESLECIELESMPFPIRANLYSALQQLRLVEAPRYLWIDALCIDQINDSEKSHQVQLMGDIYKRAARVLVWLGEAGEDSDLAFDILNESYHSDGVGEVDSPESPEVRLVKPDRDYEKAVGLSRERASSADDSEKILLSTIDTNSEEVLHERVEVPWWLTGDSVHRRKAQQISIDPDTIRLPPGGGCRQCERKSTICWWDGQGQCVRCLMSGGKTAGYCSLFESEASGYEAPKGEGRNEHFIKVRGDPADKHDFWTYGNKLKGLEIPEKVERGWNALVKLVERPWWHRVWVLQEIAVNKLEPIVMCGCKQITWSKLDSFGDISDNIEAALLDPRYLHIVMCIGTYLRIRENIIERNSLSLERLLHTSLALQSSDARDKVFSLLSLAHPIDRLNLEPDYSLSTVTVYTRTALYLIVTTRRLENLSYNAPSDSDTFPSWVSDWSFGTTRHASIFAGDLYDASAGRRAQVFRTTSQQVIALQGHCVSRVAYVSEPIKIDETWLSTSPTDLLATLKSLEAVVFRAIRDHAQYNKTPEGEVQNLSLWWRFLALDPDPRNSDAFWRTLVCDSQRLAKQPQSPAPAEWAEMFELLRYNWLTDNARAGSQPPRRRLSQVLKSVQLRAPRLRTLAQSEVPEEFMPTLPGERGLAEYIRPLVLQMEQCLHDRRFFIIESGHMGLTPGEVREGDMVVVLDGGDVPYILRNKAENPNKVGRMQFIGESYVHGLMRGELFKEFEAEETEKESAVFEIE